MSEDQNTQAEPMPTPNLMAGEERPTFDTLHRIALFFGGVVLAQPEHFESFDVTYDENLPFGISILGGAHVLLFDANGYLKEVSTSVIADGSHAGVEEEVTTASTDEGLPINDSQNGQV